MKDGPPAQNMVELYMVRTCRWGVVRVIGGDLHLQEADAVVTPAIIVYQVEKDWMLRFTRQLEMN